jgi:uncharacterized protein (TIGR03067 family)
MRRMSLLFAVLLVVPLLGSGSPKDYDVESSGVKYSDVQLVMILRGGTYALSNTMQGTYRIYPTCDPPHLDMIESEGRTIKRIFRIDGDTLRIAGAPGAQRPHGFKDEDVKVYFFKRVK